MIHCIYVNCIRHDRKVVKKVKITACVDMPDDLFDDDIYLTIYNCMSSLYYNCIIILSVPVS